MDNIKVKEIQPEYYAQVCPNCNGRSTVGYDKRPCPTCGHTDHPGIVYVPIRRKESYEESNSSNR